LLVLEGKPDGYGKAIQDYDSSNYYRADMGSNNTWLGSLIFRRVTFHYEFGFSGKPSVKIVSLILTEFVHAKLVLGK